MAKSYYFLIAIYTVTEMSYDREPNLDLRRLERLSWGSDIYTDTSGWVKNISDEKGKEAGGVKESFSQMEKGLNGTYCVSDKFGEQARARS